MHRATTEMRGRDISDRRFSALRIVLQICIVLVACVTAFLLLWEPQVEGRNIDATQYQVYFNDPFLAYIYFVFIFYFAVLYHVFMLTGMLGRGERDAARAVHALRMTKLFALLFAVGVSAAVIYIALLQPGDDDSAGGIVVGLGMVAVAVVVAVIAAQYEKRVHRTVAASEA